MCSIPKSSKVPPPPPPPPPLTPLDQSVNLSEDINSNICQPITNNPSDCIWSEDDPVLRRACVVSRICLDKAPYRHTYKNFKPIIQVGPTCGLAALSMLMCELVTPDAMLCVAKSKGYTNQGEMLSCKDMGKLLKEALTMTGIVNVNYYVRQGELNSPETIECLLNGGSLLVPYDADVNHAPALKNGHTAHWCVVTGIIMIDNPESESSNVENVYVLCRHGKSRFLAAWKLSDLAESNKNLWEFSPTKLNDEFEYIQPEGGLGGENGLRGQYILFNWLDTLIS